MRLYLIHWGRVTDICVSKLTIISLNNGLSPARAKPLSEPKLKYFNWTLGNKLQWNLNWNSYIFIQEIIFENVVWKMTAILSRPQCVKPLISGNFLRVDNFWHSFEIFFQNCNQSIYLYIVSSTEPLTYVFIKMIKVLDEIIHQKFASISVDVHRSSRHLYDVCIECWSQSGRRWWRWRWRRWPLRSFVRHQTLGNLFPHHKINICFLFWELLTNFDLFINSVSSIKNW